MFQFEFELSACPSCSLSAALVLWSSRRLVGNSAGTPPTSSKLWPIALSFIRIGCFPVRYAFYKIVAKAECPILWSGKDTKVAWKERLRSKAHCRSKMQMCETNHWQGLAMRPRASSMIGRERERYMYSTPTGVQSDNLDCLCQALSRSSRIRSVRPYVSMQRPSTSILKICCFDAHGSIWKSLSKDGGTWSSWGMNARFIACCYTYSNSCLLIWSLLSCCILTYLDRCCKVDQRKYYVHVGPARVLPQIVLVAFAGSWRSWQITAFSLILF